MLGDQQSADPWNALSPTRQAGIRAISPWVDLGTFSVMMFLGFAVRDYVSTGQLTFWVVGTIIIALVRQVIWRRTPWAELEPGRITRPDVSMAAVCLLIGVWLLIFWRMMVPPGDALVIGVCLVGMVSWWATMTAVLSASPIAFATLSVFATAAPLVAAWGRETEFDSVLWMMVILAGGILVSYGDRRRAYVRSVITEDALRDRITVISLTFAAINEGVLVTADGQVARTNPAMADLLQVPESEMIGRSVADLFGTGIVPDASVVTRIKLTRGDGSVRTVELSGNQAEELDDDVIVWICRDVTELVEQAARLTKLAGQDDLTGLPNRRNLLGRLADAANRPERLAVFVVDLDHFKSVNDHNGHAVGDEFLRVVAERLRTRVGDAGTVFRLGGDEFVILATGCRTRAEAEMLAERLVDDGHVPVRVGELELPATMSIGLAWSEEPVAGQELVHRADTAMYQVKQDGRDGWRSADDLTGSG